MEKDYLHVAAPAHFRARPDLVEELCVAEAMTRTLPRDAKQFESWRRLCGFEGTSSSFASLQPDFEKRYEPSRRYVLHPCVFPRTERISRLICDRIGWTVECEHGLYDFVFNRAVEFVVANGGSRRDAILALWPCGDFNPTDRPRFAEWSVGYERHSGECTLLVRADPETEARYLHGFGGYLMPQFRSAGQQY